MKRLYGCAALVLLVLGLVWYGSFCAQNYSAAVRTASAAAQALLLQNDGNGAAAQITNALNEIRPQAAKLAFFVPRESMLELQQCLQAAARYCLLGVHEEAFAELARAESRLMAIEDNFNRWL